MLWNEIQQYFIQNPTILFTVYVVGYLVFVFAIKFGKDNAQFAMFVFKLIYYTIGLPLLITNGVFRFFYRLIFKRPLTTGNAKASPPNILIDNPEVQIMGMRPSGKNTWTIEVRTRSDANSALITGVDSGTHGGNGSVNGEQFTYRVYRND